MGVQGTQGGMLRAGWWASGVVLAAFVLHAATGLGGEAVGALFQDHVYNILFLTGAGFCLWRGAAFREERGLARDRGGNPEPFRLARLTRASAPSHQGLRVVLVPFASGLACIGLPTYDHFGRLDEVSLVLTAAALLVVVVRTALLFSENQRMISRMHDESRTDPLTGLRNRAA